MNQDIACMPEPYYFGHTFENAERWEDFKDADDMNRLYNISLGNNMDVA